MQTSWEVWLQLPFLRLREKQFNQNNKAKKVSKPRRFRNLGSWHNVRKLECLLIVRGRLRLRLGKSVHTLHTSGRVAPHQRQNGIRYCSFPQVGCSLPAFKNGAEMVNFLLAAAQQLWQWLELKI